MSYRYAFNDSLVESIENDLDTLASVEAPDRIADSMRSDEYDEPPRISGLPVVTLEEIESQVFPKNTPVVVENVSVEPHGPGVVLRNGGAELYAMLSPHLTHDYPQKECQVGLIMRVRDSENPTFQFELFHLTPSFDH